MRTRIKANVLDAISFPISGAKLENNIAVIGGVVTPDGIGTNTPAIIIDGDSAHLFPVGREFVITGGINAGSYVVTTPGGLFNDSSALPHIEGTTEIPVASVSSTSAGGTVSGYGIDSNTSHIKNLLNPLGLQDAATKDYVDDQIINNVLPLLKAVMPPGSVASWGGIGAAPNGWLLCDGTFKNPATYPELFDAIQFTYGEQVGFFAVPDLRGRFPLGKSNGSGGNKVNRANAQTLANVDGDEFITLMTNELPIHNHPGSYTNEKPNHTHTGSTAPNGAHSHKIHAAEFSVDVDPGPVINAYWARPTDPLVGGLLATEPSHTHPLINISYTPKHSHTLLINNTIGGGSSHSNMNPYLTVQYIIKI